MANAFDMKQSYNNHTRYYPLHHFIFYPALLIAIIISVSSIIVKHEHQDEWIAITLLFIFTGWLSFMLRQHYSLNNQNRIIRLELRFRYYVLTKERFELLEHLLSFKQLAAVRFASDKELPVLVQRTIKENLSPDAIKKSIINWLPDEMRV